MLRNEESQWDCDKGCYFEQIVEEGLCNKVILRITLCTQDSRNRRCENTEVEHVWYLQRNKGANAVRAEWLSSTWVKYEIIEVSGSRWSRDYVIPCKDWAVILYGEKKIKSIEDSEEMSDLIRHLLLKDYFRSSTLNWFQVDEKDLLGDHCNIAGEKWW